MPHTPRQNPTSDGWRSALARCMPVGLLVVVAAMQLFLAHTQALVPWKGGGFGMFSTVDTLEERAIRYEVVDPSTGEFADVLIRFKDLNLQVAHERFETAVRLLHRPTHAQALAQRVMALPLTSGGGETGALLANFQRLQPPGSIHFSNSRNYMTPLQSGDHQTEPFRIATGIRVSLWRRTFDSATAEAGWQLVGDPTPIGSWPEVRP